MQPHLVQRLPGNMQTSLGLDNMHTTRICCSQEGTSAFKASFNVLYSAHAAAHDGIANRKCDVDKTFWVRAVSVPSKAWIQCPNYTST